MAKPPSRRLEALRRRIDFWDRAIVRALAQRSRLVRALAPLKPRVRDLRREAGVLANVLGQARRSGADRGFVEQVYRAILRTSRSRQRRPARRSPSEGHQRDAGQR